MSLNEQLQLLRSDLSKLESRILALKRSVNHNEFASVPDEEKKSIVLKLKRLQDYMGYVEAESQSVLGRVDCTIDYIQNAIHYLKIDGTFLCVTKIAPNRWVTLVNERILAEQEELNIYDVVRHQAIHVKVEAKTDELVFFTSHTSYVYEEPVFDFMPPCCGEAMVQVGILELDGKPTAAIAEAMLYSTNTDTKGYCYGTTSFEGCKGGGFFSRDFRTCHGIYKGSKQQGLGQYILSSTFSQQ